MNKIIQDRDYNDLVGKISTRYKNGQIQAVQAVNIGEKPSHLLSWSHYVELLKIDNKLERSFKWPIFTWFNGLFLNR